MKTLLLVTLLTTAVFAQVNIATTYNYLTKVTQAVGGDLVSITTLSNPKFDPHFITPKPSLIAKLRRQDLLIINGGGLETGWLPPLLERANNPKINQSGSGFLDVSGAVEMIDKPISVSRSYGDMHSDGNPHFAIDIYNIVPIAELISMKLSLIDPSNQERYIKNFEAFKNNMQALANALATKYKSCKGNKVVQYHDLFNYALQSYGVQSIGNIEPLPGISPSAKHTIALIETMKKQGVKIILQDVYHEKQTAKFIAQKTEATVKVVPHDIGAIDGIDTLEAFYTAIAKAICQ